MHEKRACAPRWAEPLCRIALMYQTGDLSIRELFQRAAPDLEDPDFVRIVARQLDSEPDLVVAWQQYSFDKRGTPSPYFKGTEVGFVDVIGGQVQSRRVGRFATPVDACSAFIFREASWVLHRREVG